MLNLDSELNSKENFAAGQVLLVDKPLEWTSFDIVKKIRNAVRIKKVGHAGTLDPLATGLLIVCTGKKTKSIEGFMADEKEYTGTFTIGKTTPTYDLESDVENETDFSHITTEDLDKARAPFTGSFDQVPPIYSAIKVKGTRLYELARRGEDIKLKPRPVTISEFEITKVDLPEVHFRVVCSKGTYIRSLAHDYGKALGVGAHLSALRRTRIGTFKVEDAYTIEKLIDTIRALNEDSSGN
ncbi:tRNA pseudouridine synthase B [Roseivirga pacifica]|uniref:tRNA pseudouridine synthase B n=1 Tax=Roseivirga pacifica TaxID=1267423 RepID=A0A1I0QLK2_9BACT|nr:tRNA pseudouridine(55) synthase TruB [Roseivirga pacifica]RKQ42820.1 tRNA pseudouridine synthase B [Roseivirga pacifica]SEW27965.1 tRNA pseudouridine synthase B [Roseivirga pacifica]